jgi:hypothetical protein
MVVGVTLRGQVRSPRKVPAVKAFRPIPPVPTGALSDGDGPWVMGKGKGKGKGQGTMGDGRWAMGEEKLR